MLIIALVAFFLALVGVRRQWRITAGRKLIYGSIATTFLIIISSAGYQLGTNLPVLQEVDLPAAENLVYVRVVGDSGFVVTETPKMVTNGFHQLVQGPQYLVYPIHLAGADIELGPAVEFHANNPSVFFSFNDLFSIPNSSVQYYTSNDWNGDTEYCALHVCQIDKGIDEIVKSFPMRTRVDEPQIIEFPHLYAWNNRLYIIGIRLVVLDITQPLSPRLISDEPYNHYFSAVRTPLGKLIVALPHIPNLPARQRLEAALPAPWNLPELPMLEGDILCLDRGAGSVVGGYRS
jgi:hypothetical protein